MHKGLNRISIACGLELDMSLMELNQVTCDVKLHMNVSSVT